MLHRFNNPVSPPVHAPFDDPNFSRFQGGTFSGVREALGYIKRLGAGAIWLSPVLKNLPFRDDAYHCSGIHDFLHAEPRFASVPEAADDELRALVDAAHAEGLYVSTADCEFLLASGETNCPLCKLDAALRVPAATQAIRSNRTAELKIASQLRLNTEHCDPRALDRVLASSRDCELRTVSEQG